MNFQITDDILDAWDQELGFAEERQATPAVSRSVPQTKGSVEQALTTAGKFELTPEVLDQWDRELGFDKEPVDAAAREAVAEPAQVEGPGVVARGIGKALGNVVGLGDLLPDVEVRLGQDRPAELVPRSDPRGPEWEKQGAEISSMLGRGVAHTAKAAWENGDFGQTQEELIDSYRAVRDKVGADQEFLKSREDWAEGLPEGILSLPYSLTTMGASLLGSLAGSPGGKTGSVLGGMAASGATAYRASRHDFMGNLLLKASQELGRVPTPEEWTALQDKFDGAATKYGAWEAIPEAVGNAMFMGVVGPGSKWVADKLSKKLGTGLVGRVVKGPVGRVTAGMVGTQAEEQSMEGLTGWGQGGVEAEVGLRDKAPTLAEAYKESFAPTFWMTMITGGLGTGASHVYDRWKQSGRITEPEADPTQTQIPSDPAREQAARDTLDQGREVDLLDLTPTDPATPPPAVPSAPAAAAASTVTGRVDELADTLGQMNDVPVVDEANEISPAVLGTPEGDAAFQESQRAAAEAAVPVGGKFVPDGAQPVAPVAEQAPDTPFTPSELQGMMPAPEEPILVPPMEQAGAVDALDAGQGMPSNDVEKQERAPWQMTLGEYLEAKPDGPKSRMNTHEHHVREALEQGLPVPPEVLARYKGRYWMERQPEEPVAIELEGGFGGGEGAAPPGHVSIFDQAVSFGEVAGQHKQEGMDDRRQGETGGADAGQVGQGFQQDDGGPVGDIQAGAVQQDDQGQGGSLQAGSFVEDQSRIAEALDYADNVTRHLVGAGALTEEEAGLIEQAERDESEARLADLAYEMSMHAEVRDHALDIHERVISRIRKLGGINYDHAREQMGRDGIQWMQSRFGLGFVSSDGVMLDELADMLSAEVPELAIDREVQNLMDLLRDRVQSKKAIEQDYSRAVDGVRMEMSEIIGRLQERQDYREGKNVFDQRAESDTEQANAPPHDPALDESMAEFMAEYDRQLAEKEAKAQKPKTLREKGKERREKRAEPSPEKQARATARANRKPGQTLKDAKAEVADHAQGLADSLKAAADVFSRFGGLSVRIVKDGEEVNQDLYRELKPHLTKALEHLKAMGVAGKDLVREFVSRAMEIFGANAAKARPYFAKFVREEIAGGTNVDQQRGGEDLERDSRAGQPGNGVGQESLLDERGGAEPGGGQGIQGAAETGRGSRSGQRLPGRAAPAGGEQGDTGIREETSATERGPAGSEFGERGDTAGHGGHGIEPVPDQAVARAAAKRAEADERIADQKKAPTAQKSGDLANIAETLPVLYEGQHKDVQFAELRFEKGAGVMFTNGTGTGKTGSGLGIVKRLVNADKTNILIAVPADKIAKDWIDFAAKYLNLTVTQLKDTKDAGKGVVITTHANMGMNDALASRQWDLVIIDEAHKLMSSENGDVTDALNALRAITMHKDGAYKLARMRHPDLYAAHEEASVSHKWATDEQIAKSNAAYTAWRNAMRAVDDEVRQARERGIRSRLDATDGRPGVVFLSATPFAYVKDVDYAAGYLFDYPEVKGTGYNAPSGQQSFMIQHFGFRMRTGKMNKPEADVDSGLMERQFNSWLKREKVLSSRTLQVDFDYDRRFVLVESAIGRKIDEGLELLRSKRFRELGDKVGKTFDHLARRYLLEAIKAREAISVIEAHLARGRKVVIFHDYKQGGNWHNPFDVSGYTLDDDEQVRSQARAFRDEYPDLVNLPIKGLSSPIDALTRAFPNLLLFNGDVPGKQRNENVKLFQDDDSGRNLILVQSAAGEAGISLHDTTGTHQRVLINLGLPTRPVTAMQQEGRIYRVGQASHAIFRYLNTGTSWERWAFASTIAGRASTAENLAMGEEARALRDGFIQAFEDSDAWEPGHESEGLGGKERDAAAMAAISEWDRARTMYFGQQKKTSRTKAAEGADYFATPEPLGLKMVEWAGISPGMDVLEPSAGHGAIARWFPDLARKVVIEPSHELASRIGLVSDAKIVTERFEDHHVVNKYDAIVMNPPFGTAGKLAMEHVAKAFTHLREGGRIVALIPEGPSMEKRFDAWYESEAAKHAHLRMSLSLPAVTFERAGTSVRTRVVVIDKAEKPVGHVEQRSPSEVGGETIKDFFENLEHRTAPDRVRTEDVVQQEAAEKASSGEGVFFDAAETKHSKTGEALYVAKKAGQVSDADYKKLASMAKAHGGWWSSYKASGAIPGFQFKDRKGRDVFLQEANELLQGVGKVAEGPAQYQTKPGSVRTASSLDGGVHAVDGASETVRAEQIGGEYGKERTLAESEPENEREGDISGRRGADSVSGAEPGSAGRLPGVRSVLLKTVEKQYVPAKIKSDLDAAVAVASLADQPQENMVALVLDAGNKPLAILHHSKGSTDSTVAEPAILSGSVLDVPGARYVYLAHNHPGEKAYLSPQDVKLAGTYHDLFEGSGVKMLGLLAVTSNSFANELGGNIPIPASSGKGKRVPVQVRVFFGVYEPERVIRLNDPNVLIRHSETITGGADSGIVLLNTQNVVVGFVPMSPQHMATLRGNGLGNILRAMHRANANGVLGVIPGIFDTKAWHNVAALARVAGLRALDVLYRDQHGDLQSFRGNGQDFGGDVDVFFSRAENPTAKGMPAADVKSVVDAVAGNWAKAPVVNVVQSVRDLPAKILGAVRKAGAEGDVQAVYHNGTIHIIADRMASADHVRRTLLHEGTGHHGLRLIMRKAELNRALDLAWENSKVRDAAGEIAGGYELDLSDLDQRREAVEEVLAHWAETGVRAWALDRFVAAVRRALRRVLPGLKMTDAEVLDLIVRARRAVVEGKGARAVAGGGAKMSRNPADIGMITEEIATAIGWQPGPIRLGPEDMTHIAERHQREIARMGYPSVSDFVKHVVENFDAVYQGYGRSVFLAVRGGKTWKAATVKMEFEPKGNFWRVVSASPVRPDYFVNLEGVERKKLLWEGAQSNHRLAATPSAVSGQSSYEGNISATDEDDNTYLSRGRGRKSISIDGIERPAVNSEGRPIHESTAGIVNFWRWFDGFQRGRVGGKAVAGAYAGGNRRGVRFDSADGRRGREVGLDDRGRPRVFFHGTAEAIDAFDLDHPNRKDNGWLGRGVYLISDSRIAETYANLKGGFKNQAVMPLYAAVRNPYHASLKIKQKLRRFSKTSIERWTQGLKDQGFDGVVLDFPDGTTELVAFYPEQVKSVTGNAGSFDSANDDIRFSRGEKKTKLQQSAFKTRADAAEAGMQTGADTGALKEPLRERAPTNHRLAATPSAVSGQSGSSDESLETFGEGDNTRFFRAATQVSQTVAGMATPMTPAQIAAELEANRTFANKIHEGRDQVRHQIKLAATEMQRAVQRLADSKKWKYNPLKIFSSEKELKDSSRSRLLDAAMLVHREMQINPDKVQEFKDWAREQLEVKKVKGEERLRIQDQLRVLEAAENLTIEQKQFVDDTMNNAFETLGGQAKNAGVVNTLLDNYVRRLWNRPQDGDKAVFSGAGHAFKTFTTASKARSLETIFDGWIKGYDLQIKGITSSWAAIAGEIGEIVANKQFIQEGRAQGVLSARRQKGYAELQGKGFQVWVRKAGVKIRMRDVYGLLGTDGQGRKMYVSTPNRYWAVYTDKAARRADTLFDDEALARAYAEQLREQGAPGAWVEFRQEVDIFEKVPLYAPEKVADLINRMTRAMDGDSPWKAPLPRAILAFNNAAKGWILMTSFFHHLAGARSWAFGVNQGALEALRKGDVSDAVQKMARSINPVSAHKRGLEKIRTSNAVLRQLIKHGLTLGELADWSEGVASEHRGITDRLFTHLSGRLPGAEKVVAGVRAGRYFRERAANALFKRYFAGLKAEAAVLEYGHQLDAEIREANREGRVPNPDLVAERVARLVNDDFGGLHLARMGRHPGVQAGLRLLLLAPDWTESNWRTITGMVPGLNDAVARMMHEVPAPPGMDKVYRRFWARIIVVGALHTLALQVLVSALLGDDDDHWYDLYKDQFADWDALRRMKWTGVDVTPIYKRLGVDVPKGERRVFSVVGHFADFLRIMDPENLIKGKLSPLMRIVGALGTKTDYRERPFTGVKELVTTGQTVKSSRHLSKEQFFDALPSILAAQIRDLQPIQVGYLLKYLQGEEEGLTALLASGGAHMSATQKPDVIGKEFEEAAKEVNRARLRWRELGELRAAYLALYEKDPAAAEALRTERAADFKEARTFRRDNEKLLRLYPMYARVREALGEQGRSKRLQEAYVLDKNKRSTSVDTLDENIEKLKRTFVEKYRKAG